MDIQAILLAFKCEYKTNNVKTIQQNSKFQTYFLDIIIGRIWPRMLSLHKYGFHFNANAMIVSNLFYRPIFKSLNRFFFRKSDRFDVLDYFEISAIDSCK